MRDQTTLWQGNYTGEVPDGIVDVRRRFASLLEALS